MRLGTSLRQSVLSIAQGRALTTNMQSADASAAIDTATMATGDATGLVRHMTAGFWQDDGTPGGVTARASRGVEA